MLSLHCSLSQARPRHRHHHMSGEKNTHNKPARPPGWTYHYDTSKNNKHIYILRSLKSLGATSKSRRLCILRRKGGGGRRRRRKKKKTCSPGDLPSFHTSLSTPNQNPRQRNKREARDSCQATTTVVLSLFGVTSCVIYPIHPRPLQSIPPPLKGGAEADEIRSFIHRPTAIGLGVQRLLTFVAGRQRPSSLIAFLLILVLALPGRPVPLP